MKMDAYQKNNGFHCYGDLIGVNIKLKQSEIFIPSLFTPVENSLNGFEIKGLDGLADDNLYIVNQWGVEIYKHRKYKNSWAAEGLEEGTYYYLLMIKESEDCIWETFKGSITLIRRKK